MKKSKLKLVKTVTPPNFSPVDCCIVCAQSDYDLYGKMFCTKYINTEVGLNTVCDDFIQLDAEELEEI